MVRTDDHEEVAEWELDELLDCKQMGGNHHWHYTVAWTHHDPTEEPIANVINARRAIITFHSNHPDAPIPPEVQKWPEIKAVLRERAPAPRAPPAPRAAPAPPAPPAPPRRSRRIADLKEQINAAVTSIATGQQVAPPLGPGPMVEAVPYESEALSVEDTRKLDEVFGKIFGRLSEIWQGKRLPTRNVEDKLEAGTYQQGDDDWTREELRDMRRTRELESGGSHPRVEELEDGD
jgi:hypothetical protein